MVDISAAAKQQIAKLTEGAGSGATVTLDPGDEAHRALITELLDASGKGADRYPALHQAVQNPNGGAPAADAHHAQVVDLGRDASGRATSRTWVASRGGAFISGATTLVLDAESGKTLASGTATQVGGNLVQVATRTAEAQPAAQKQTAVTFFHAQPSPEAAPTFALVSETAMADEAQIPIVVQEPVKSTATGNPNIVIAVARDTSHQNPDSDYAYPQSQNQDPDRLVVPFQGFAELTYATDVSEQNPISVTTQLYVTSSQAYLNPYSGFDLLGPITASGNLVSWSFPYDGQPVMLTESVQYESNTSANDNTTAFFFQFNVPVANQVSPVFTFTVCSSDWPEAPSVNCQVIPNLQYWWHCVAAGTRVTLADGSEVPVEEVDNKCEVRTGIGGGTGAVEATSRARHDAGGRPAYRLRTRGGRELLLSDGHPVITPSGPVAARDLRPGDPVLAADGEDAVERCDAETYDGIVCNLRLADDAGRTFGSYLANGIVVGDHDAQAAYERATRHDPDYVLSRIPETHHQDWRSALADATAR